MLNSIRSSIKDSFIFGFGNLAVKVIGFVLIPLYTNPEYFSIEDFGIIGILDLSGLILIALLSSSLPQSLTRWYWAKEHPGSQKEIFFMTFITQIILSFLFAFLLIPLSGNISEMIFDTATWRLAIVYIIISSALQGINNLMNTLLRLQARSFLFMLTNLAKLVTVLILTVYFIIFRDMGIAGIYLAQVIGNALIILVLLPLSIKNCSIGFDLNIWKPMVNYGMPLVLANFASVMLNAIDRYALNSLAPLKYVAIYTLAYKVSSSLKLILVDTIKLAVFPRMIQKIDSPDNGRFYAKTMLYSSWVVMGGIIGVSLFSLEVIKVFVKTTELWSAYLLVPVLAISTYFMNLREVSVYGLIVTKKTRKISFTIIVSTALNIILNLLFIPVWNAMGAAVATLISQFFYWWLLQYIAQKAYYIPYQTGKVTLIFITGSILSFAGIVFNDMELIPRLIIKFILFLSFPFILYFFNFYEPVELQFLKSFFKKWTNLRKLKENLMSLKNITDDL